MTGSRAGEFDEFFHDNYNQLVRSLTLITGDRELAADCVQDAFIRAYARWHRIGAYDSPAGWVRRVAINRSRDVLRSTKRREDTEARANALRAEVSSPADADLGLDLEAEIAKLPQRQRMAIGLFYLDGLSVQQVAEAMNLSVGAVKYNLNRGRGKLTGYLSALQGSVS